MQLSFLHFSVSYYQDHMKIDASLLMVVANRAVQFDQSRFQRVVQINTPYVY